MSKIEALLFDLGGVLIDIDFNRVFEHWLPISALSLEEIQATFKVDVPYQQHECGEIPVSTYFDHLRSSLKLQGDHGRIAEGWNAIFAGEIHETRRMVQAALVRSPADVRIVLAALSAA